MEILRNDYIKQLLQWKDKPFIKVITGVRRCGKSTVLKQFKQHIAKTNKKLTFKIISYDFNDKKLSDITWKQLIDIVVSKADNKKNNYLFLDEVQEINDFEKALITLYEHKKIKFDIYISGSNSKMFSASLATLLTGRNIQIKMYPLSFKEYLVFAKTNSELSKMAHEQIFDKYMEYGAMPIILKVFNDKEALEKVLNVVLEDTINKDVSQRHAIKTLPEFNRFINFALENNGMIFSTKSISDYLKSNNKSKTTNKTVERYLAWLCEALLFYKVDFFDAKGKKLLETSSKYYCVDTGIRNAHGKNSLTNRSMLLENIVYLELLRRGYKVSIGKLRGKEIDFVALKDKNITYIQVAVKLDTEKLKDREYGNLRRIHDNYKKIVITEERASFIDDTGIQTINIINWLLNDSK